MKQRRSSSDPYNQNKPWTLADRRLAYLTFTRKDVTELEKFQLARSLGRRATSVQVMVFSLMPALPGKEKKFREENALLTQPFAKDPSKTVEQTLGGANVTEYVRIGF